MSWEQVRLLDAARTGAGVNHSTPVGEVGKHLLSSRSGQAILLSPEPVTLGQWHRLVAERNKRAGHLTVDHGVVERKTSPGKAQGLNIHTPMYLGGVPSMDILPKPANISGMFQGCVGEVRSRRKQRW